MSKHNINGKQILDITEECRYITEEVQVLNHEYMLALEHGEIREKLKRGSKEHPMKQKENEERVSMDNESRE